ncbi:MAG: adenylate kinase [Bacteroidetes bacterium]|nr:adenylate kinase [Chitinophagales bacterium]MDA0199303.1 adenylate kinase [Bacteroidota bacterium]
MLNIIMFGPPGSGKGTQAALLKDNYSLLHISTGDLLRAEQEEETALGLEAKMYMDAGHLVPDSVVIGMIDNKLNALEPGINGIIFDGFPRTIAQAEALDELLAKRDNKIDAVLLLEVSQNEIVRRILERGLTSGRGDDLDVETIIARYNVFLAQTAPVAQHYQNVTHHINGEGDIDIISKDLIAVIEEVF